MKLLRRAHFRPSDNRETTSTSVGSTRSVVTFFHEAVDDESLPIKQEIDLQDFEVLVESYKFLLKGLRRKKSRSKKRSRLNSSSHHSRSNETLSSFSNHSHRNIFAPRDKSGGKDSLSNFSNHSIQSLNSQKSYDSSSSSSSSTSIMSERHKQAILTLVDVDKTTKRVIRIRPEFFPRKTRVLPSYLKRLRSLKSLSLDHCSELTCLPAGFFLPNLKELRVDVTSFQEPFPASFGKMRNLETLVVKGNCLDLNDLGSDGGAALESMLLFPPSMAKLTNLKHLETHVRNLLQIPVAALEIWSTSLEKLVTTHDLSSSNHKDQDRPNTRSRAFSTDDSSEDDFEHLDNESFATDDDEEEEDGFSFLKHNDIFRKALESQIEVRAFRSIAKFQNLRSLKLVFDDSKYRTDYGSVRNRRLEKHRNHNTTITSKIVEAPYTVPLSLLAGPLSTSLRVLDIGTWVASSTPSSSRKKSRIPIEIAWIDVLQEFPMLQRLRLQDCRCSFSSKTDIVDLTASTMILPNEPDRQMSELRHLVLDRCPDFAVVDSKTSGTTREDANDHDRAEGINCGPEKIVVSTRHDGVDSDKDPDAVLVDDAGVSSDEYFQPLNDDDVDAIVEEDPEEIARIIHLTGLLADTILAPDDAETVDDDRGRSKKLSYLCTKFLRRCPKLEILTLRDCKIPEFSEDLLSCLPRDCLREMTLDVRGPVDANDIWAFAGTYQSLVRLQGTCLKSLLDSERNKLRRSLLEKQHRSDKNDHKTVNPQMRWRILREILQQDKYDGNKNKLLLNIRFSDKENTDSDTIDARIIATPSPATDDRIRAVLPSLAETEDRVPLLQQQQHRSSNGRQRRPIVFGIPVWPVAAIKKLKAIERGLRKNNPATAAAAAEGSVLRSIRRSNSRDML